MNIFIGSSSEQLYGKTRNEIIKLSYEEKQVIARKSKQEEIAELLENDGHAVYRWWSPGTLEFGSQFISSLIKITDICEGAVLFFGNDDKIEDIEEISDTFVSRDNVYIEYGMFVSKYGPGRTFAILDDQVQRPSNISGINYPKINDRELTKHAKEFFSKINYDAKRYKKMTFFVSKDTTNSIIEDKCKEWKSRSLYIGLESARKWRTIEQSDEYFGKKDIGTTKQIFSSPDAAELFKPPVENIISLGPGVGRIDSDVISTIIKKNGTNIFYYIPIDISLYLAFMASNELSKKACVPFSIIDDFENEHSKIGDLIDEKLKIKKQKNLYLMLGGTFANLEGKEDNFFNNIKKWMSGNDYFLLDVFIKSNDYNVEADERTHIKDLPASYKKFMINSIQTKFGNMNKSEFDSIFSAIEKHISCEPISHCDLHDQTELDRDNDETIQDNQPSILHYKYKNQVLFIAKRYDFQTLEAYLEDHGFHVVSRKKSFKPGKIVGRGVFLLRLKTD